MKVDQTVLPRKRHLGQTSELLRQQHSSYANVHIGQQAHHILSVQRAQKQHMVTKTTSHLVGSKRSSPGRFPTFALISSLMCRVAIEQTCGRSTIVEKNVHQRRGQRQCAEQKVQQREYVADCTQHDAPNRHNCQSEMKLLRHGSIVARH